MGASLLDRICGTLGPCFHGAGIGSGGILNHVPTHPNHCPVNVDELDIHGLNSFIDDLIASENNEPPNYSRDQRMASYRAIMRLDPNDLQTQRDNCQDRPIHPQAKLLYSELLSQYLAESLGKKLDAADAKAQEKAKAKAQKISDGTIIKPLAPQPSDQ